MGARARSDETLIRAPIDLLGYEKYKERTMKTKE